MQRPAQRRLIQLLQYLAKNLGLHVASGEQLKYSGVGDV